MKSKIVVLFLLISSFVSSQEIKNNDQISFPSPNAASLGIYGKVPIGMHTGTPEISIPIYEIKEGRISVPVTLSYHSSGIRPEEQPSWVGLGWSLQAGGAITRIVKGIPDEANKNYHKKSYGIALEYAVGYFYTYSMLEDEYWYSYANQNDNPWKESMPDEFDFNFLGISGTFYIDHLGNFRFKSDIPLYMKREDVVISPIINNADSYKENDMFLTFVISDANGLKYTFGGNMESIEFTRPQYGSKHPFPEATTWNLTKIEDPFGNKVELKYIRGNLIPQFSYSENQQSSEGDNNKGFLLNYKCNQSSYSYDYDCKLIEPSYLETIITNNSQIWLYSSSANDLEVTIPYDSPLNWFAFSREGPYTDGYPDISQKLDGVPIDFNTTPDEFGQYGIASSVFRKRKKLDKIVVFPSGIMNYPDNDNSNPEDKDYSAGLKLIDFKYIEQPDKRLMLESLTIHDISSTLKSVHNFCYYDDPQIELPPYGTFNVDHWGYYNGIKARLSGDNYAGYFAQRQPSADIRYQLEGMLKRITYPTGGYSEMEYEPHSYSSYFKRIPMDYSNYGSPIGLNYIDIEQTNENIIASGLRVKKITTKANLNDVPLTKKYLYVQDYNGITNGKSSGYLINLPKYYWDAELAVVKSDDDSWSHHLISFVKDKWPTRLSNSPLGIFKDFLDPGEDPKKADASFSLFSSNSLLPLSVSGAHIVYSQVIEIEEGKGFTKNTFSMPKKVDPSNPQFDRYQDLPSLVGVGNSYFEPLIDLSLERGKLLKEEIFDKSNTKVKEIEYLYNSDVNRFRENNIRSRSIGNLKHCADNSIFYTGSAIVYFIYPVYIEEEKVTDFAGGNQIVTSTTYKYTSNKQIREITTLQSDGNYKHTVFTYPYDYSTGTTFIDALKTNNNFPPIEVVSYIKDKIISGTITKFKTDGKGNPDEVRILEPLNGESIPFVEYRFSNKSVKGLLPYGTSNTSAFSEFSTSYGIYVQRVKYDSYNSSGKLVQLTDIDGISKSYVWSYKNTLPIAEVKNATYQQVIDGLANKNINISTLNDNILSDEVIQNNTNLLRTELPNSPISSYTYSPVFNQITSITDANDIKTYYEYDKLGELITVRDNNNSILKSYKYNYDNSPRACCEYIGCSNPVIDFVVIEPDYITFNASIVVTNKDVCDINKSISFQVDGITKSITHSIPPNQSVEFRTYFSTNSITDNNLHITGSCNRSIKIPEVMTPLIHSHGSNLPATGEVGQTLNVRCLLKNTGNVDGQGCVNFKLSKSQSGSNPIVSSNICNLLESGDEIEVSTNLTIPSGASGTFWLVMETNTGNILLAENYIAINSPPPPLVFTISISKYPLIGTHFNLSATPSESGYSYSYRWSGSGLVDVNPTGNSVECIQTSTQTITYTVTATCISNNCSGGSASKSITIANGLPPID